MQEDKQEKSPIKQKILRFLEAKGVSHYEFYKNSGVTRGVLTQPSGISEENIARFLAYAPEVNPTWLLRGIGSMYIDDINQEQSPSPSDSIDTYQLPNKGVPYYDIDFLGGFAEVFSDQTILPSYYIDVKPFNHADCWCNLSGDSMSPKINNGDIIALKQCHLESVQYGEMYAVDMGDLRTVKILRKGKDARHLRFIPVNTEEYDEQEFPISRILRIFKVLGSMRRSF